MRSTCVVFACSIFSHERLFVLREFLNSIEQNFSDSDVYMGINYGCLPEVEEISRSYNINLTLSRLKNEDMYSQSDASAYQIALGLLKSSGKTYEYYWFIHTKSGVNSHSDYLRGWYISKLLGRHNEIEPFIESKEEIGSYGLLGLEYDENRTFEDTDVEIQLFKNILTPELPYNHAPFFYIHAMYVLKNGPMEVFFKNTTEKWFNTRLDRYYFEGVFPFVVSRSGYIPYISNRISCSGKDLKPSIDLWISKDLKKDTTIEYETCYQFLQLKPPM